MEMIAKLPIDLVLDETRCKQGAVNRAEELHYEKREPAFK